MSNERYLGDGLYASFDGFMFTLRAPRREGDHWVGLEPEVLRAFDEYRKHIKEKIDERHSEDNRGNPGTPTEVPES